MKIEEAINELKTLNKGLSDKDWDCSDGHVRADEILCEILSDIFNCKELVEAYNEVCKWYE